MQKITKGIILIVMMFGHNYVINQAQALQEQIQSIHQINVPQFNLLYSIPSAVSIVFIIPLGILYDKFCLTILTLGTLSLVIGQLLVAIFGSIHNSYSYRALIGGRVMEGVGAQILYMIQGNLASSWMGKLAGLVFILPEIGQIANVFGTPYVASNYGIQPALIIGFITCLLSAAACSYLYCYLKKKSVVKIVEHKLIQIQLKTLEGVEDKTTATVDQMKKDVDRTGDSSSISNVEDHLNQAQSQATPKSLLKVGNIFWVMIALCAVNECLYFPFLDNANQLLQKRFCVKYERTGIYLCLPFIAAIVITAIYGKYILHRFERKKLILVSSLFPLIGHSIIYLVTNCSDQKEISGYKQVVLMIGFIIFGMGLGSYYSVSFPAIGYMVPSSIRGTTYACLCFFQTISMTLVPILSGFIIQQQQIDFLGYQKSSFLFMCLCGLGTLLSYIIFKFSTQMTFRYYNQDKEQQYCVKDEKCKAKIQTKTSNIETVSYQEQ